MSLQAELVRVWLRWSMKRSNHPNVTIEERRRRLAAYERWVPRPPRWLEVSMRRLGGAPARRFSRRDPRSRGHILFLHGRAYTTGSAALDRRLYWRYPVSEQSRVAP